MTPQRPGFSGYRLDRADHLRADDDALTMMRRDKHARLLVLDGYTPSLTDDGALVWGSLANASVDAAFILLGISNERPHFVAFEQPVAGAPLFRSPQIMQTLARLSREDMAIYGAARSLIDWHGRHGFCSQCGQATRVHRAGWGRKCVVCNAEHFPRVDPVVIMLAEHDGRALVGRAPKWPAGRYSALAGFLEPGETIEEAVARELFEEAGVVTTTVRYVTSQPWPFPAQLMLACIAEVKSPALTLAPTEIEDAFWVTKQEALAALAGDAGARFLAPPHYAVAHSLLTQWAAS